MESAFLSLVSLVIAVLFLVFLVLNFSNKFDPRINAVKLLTTALLAILGVIQENWLSAGIWAVNFALYLYLAVLNLKLKALQNQNSQAQYETYTAPYDTVGTNCTACGAKNEYPVDGRAHYCTHCGTVLPRAF